MQSNGSGHWTDDELLSYLYAEPRETTHVSGCAECQARVAAMLANRRQVDALSEDSVNFNLLAQQRRMIYARMTEPRKWWTRMPFRAWASTAIAVLFFASGLLVYEQRHTRATIDNSVSDAQLAAQVSNMADDAEPQSTAPLQALFEE